MDKEKLIMMLLDNKEDTKSWYEIGGKYIIRTVTMIYTGKLIKEYPDYLLLDNAAWIAETERWTDTLTKCIFKEVEPYPKEVIVYKSAILDVTTLKELPSDQK
jgi:hypothetical protein